MTGPHTWNDPPETTAEDLLREAQSEVLNIWHLLAEASDQMNRDSAPRRAVALIEVARDMAWRLQDRMTEE